MEKDHAAKRRVGGREGCQGRVHGEPGSVHLSIVGQTFGMASVVFGPTAWSDLKAWFGATYWEGEICSVAFSGH